jgi:hypothetical protein
MAIVVVAGDEWHEMLVNLAAAEEEVCREYAVVIESDVFRTDFDLERTGISTQQRVFFLAKKGKATVFAYFTFPDGDTDGRHVEISLKNDGVSHRFFGGWQDLFVSSVLRLDDRPVAETLGDSKVFSPFVVPVSSMAQVMAGAATPDLIDKLAVDYGVQFEQKLDEHIILRVSKGKGGALIQYKINNSDLLPVELIWKSRPRNGEPNSWKTGVEYCTTRTNWTKFEDKFYPKEVNFSLKSLGTDLDGLRSETTDRWRFHWLDPEAMDPRLFSPEIVSYLKAQEPSSAVFYSLIKTSTKIR